jgi:2-(3-amino-3-carboxypropyl)histidine synthase
MQTKTISEINEIYDLEIKKIVGNIKKRKAKRVLLQFPEGLKPYSTVVSDEIENKTGCQCFIWLGDCFGGCDIPNVDGLDIDLIVQFGHSKWEF